MLDAEELSIPVGVSAPASALAGAFSHRAAGCHRPNSPLTVASLSARGRWASRAGAASDAAWVAATWFEARGAAAWAVAPAQQRRRVGPAEQVCAKLGRPGAPTHGLTRYLLHRPSLPDHDTEAVAEEGGEYAEMNNLLKSLHFERLSRRASGRPPDSDSQQSWHLDTRHSQQDSGAMQ